ncbi:hypothetical protein BREVNS_1948 [Brevinematales bacterium NS]|nr:hypothetical protein BREVNS_1948 [Brevinematales bacterium NS]
MSFALTMSQQTHLLVKRLTSLHTNPNNDDHLLSGRKAYPGYYHVSANEPPLLK